MGRCMQQSQSVAISRNQSQSVAISRTQRHLHELVLLERIGAVDVVSIERMACGLLRRQSLESTHIELNELVKVDGAVAVGIRESPLLLEVLELLRRGRPPRRHLLGRSQAVAISRNQRHLLGRWQSVAISRKQSQSVVIPGN